MRRPPGVLVVAPWIGAGLHADEPVAALGIGARPPANPHAEAWIRQGDADALNKGDLYTARLTLDITPALRARIKVSAFTQGVTVADLLRGLVMSWWRDYGNTQAGGITTVNVMPGSGHLISGQTQFIVGNIAAVIPVVVMTAPAQAALGERDAPLTRILVRDRGQIFPLPTAEIAFGA